MDAINFILKEHAKVRKALAGISKTSRFSSKQKKFEVLAEVLICHETMEQKVWYPYFKDDKEVKNKVKHLISEEKKAAKAIKKLVTIKNEARWDEKFSQLKEEVEHHADEEETQLFPLVENLLSDAQLEKIGKELRQFKKKFEDEKS